LSIISFFLFLIFKLRVGTKGFIKMSSSDIYVSFIKNFAITSFKG